MGYSCFAWHWSCILSVKNYSKEINMSLIIPIYPLTDRSIKRGFIREKKQVEHLLIDIECEFEYSIFNAPKNLSYSDIYTHFLNKWQELYNRLLVDFNFSYIVIDLHHFVNKYKSRI